MHLFKAAFLSTLALAIILTTSLVSDHYDKKKWLEITNSFEHAFLPNEIKQYADYLQRKRVLNSQNNSEDFDTEFLKQLSTTELSQLILLDRPYKNYILSEGHLFIDPWTLSVWKESRSQVDNEVGKLLISRLALDQNNIRPSSILSHVLVNDLHPRLFILLAALSMSMFLLFNVMRTPHLLAAIFAYLAISSFLLLLLNQPSDPISYGSVGLLLCLWTLSIRVILTKQLWLNFLSGKKLTTYVVIMNALILLFFGLSLYAEALNTVHLLAATIASLLTLAMTHQNDKIEAREKLATKTVASDSQKEYRPELAKALDFISRFEFDNAKQTLNNLAKKYPNSLTILEQRYHLAKFQPELSTFKELVEQLIQMSSERNDYRRMLTLFKDIQKTTKSKQRASSMLMPEHYHKMMTVFLDHNDLDKTEQVFHFLELNASDSLKIDACSLLIEKFKSMQNTRKQQQYEMLLQRFG